MLSAADLDADVVMWWKRRMVFMLQRFGHRLDYCFKGENAFVIPIASLRLYSKHRGQAILLKLLNHPADDC